MGTSQSAENKIKWFEKIFKYLETQGKTLDLNQIVADFCITHYSTKRKALEIIKLFEASKRIKVFGGEIGSPSTINEKMSICSEEQKKLSTMA